MPDRMSSDRASAPLAGLRVLDLSLLLPGPFSTQILADLGADVIKVEPPAGDGTRQSPTGIFPIANRNKRSIVLDLKTAAGVQRCLDLAVHADVFVEGFRPKVLERLGVGYAQVAGVRPDIVYCSISGYGQTGPDYLAPGHDVNYLASSGGLAYSGDWRSTGRQRPGIPVADLSASMYAAVSILAALRRRDASGQGAYIDLSLADCAMAFATVRGGLGQAIRDEDRLHLYPTNGLFECADGQYLAVGLIEDRFWDAFVAVAAEYDARLGEPKFASEPLRRQHGDELVRLLESVFLRAPAQQWAARLASKDVPASRVLSLAEAVDTPQARERGIVEQVSGHRQVMFPALWDGAPIAGWGREAPGLGEHTDEVARQFGLG